MYLTGSKKKQQESWANVLFTKKKKKVCSYTYFQSLFWGGEEMGGRRGAKRSMWKYQYFHSKKLQQICLTKPKVSQHLKLPTGQYTVYDCSANSSIVLYECSVATRNKCKLLGDNVGNGIKSHRHWNEDISRGATFRRKEEPYPSLGFDQWPTNIEIVHRKVFSE